VIPVAGLGTRFLPVSKCIPKEMLPIVDKPIIQYIVEEIKASGLEEVILVTSEGKEAIENHFKPFDELTDHLKKKGKDDLYNIAKDLESLITVKSVIQDQPLGLGHAVNCAADLVGDEPFAVILGDDMLFATEGAAPGIRQLIDVYEKTGQSSIGLMQIEKENSFKYGMAEFEDGRELLEIGDHAKVSSFIEKPAPDVSPSRMALPGRYVLTSNAFSVLSNLKPGAGGELQLTDALDELARTEGVQGVTLAGRRIDAGDKLGFLEANIFAALNRDEFKNDLIKVLKDALSGLPN
jgi:UTP--glucose-1-phosphate uridylyltransferase